MSAEIEITNAVSDVGGVFVRSRSEGKIAVARSLGLNNEQLSTFWSWVAEELGRGLLSEQELWERTAEVFEVRRVDSSEGLLRMSEIVYDEKAIQRFQHLGNYGIQLSLFTNTISPHADQLRDFYGRFPRVFRSDEIGRRKPDTESYQFVLGQLNADPSRTLFFDDSEANIRAAASLGMLAVQVSSALEIEEGIRLYIPDYSPEPEG